MAHSSRSPKGASLGYGDEEKCYFGRWKMANGIWDMENGKLPDWLRLAGQTHQKKPKEKGGAYLHAYVYDC